MKNHGSKNNNTENDAEPGSCGLWSETMGKSLVERTVEGKEEIAFPGYIVLWKRIAG